MKVAWWFGVGTVLILVLLVATNDGEQHGNIPEHSSEILPEAMSESDALVPGSGQPGSVDDLGNVTLATPMPDRVLGAGSTNIIEPPPRTIFGIEPVKQSTDLPIVDPAALPFDKNFGRIEVVGAVRAGDAVSAGASHPLSPSGDQPPVETDDGPLAGVIPRPAPSAPGPADIPVSGSTSVPTEIQNAADADAYGPGQPIDPAAAEAMPPMYVLPGADVSIEDPDLSPGTRSNDDSN